MIGRVLLLLLLTAAPGAWAACSVSTTAGLRQRLLVYRQQHGTGDQRQSAGAMRRGVGVTE